MSGIPAVLPTVSTAKKRSNGALVAAAGKLFDTATTVNDSTLGAVAFNAKALIDRVPAVVESEATPASEPVPAVVLRVN
jgi:hypothetical protein